MMRNNLMLLHKKLYESLCTRIGASTVTTLLPLKMAEYAVEVESHTPSEWIEKPENYPEINGEQTSTDMVDGRTSLWLTVANAQAMQLLPDVMVSPFTLPAKFRPGGGGHAGTSPVVECVEDGLVCLEGKVFIVHSSRFTFDRPYTKQLLEYHIRQGTHPIQMRLNAVTGLLLPTHLQPVDRYAAASHMISEQFRTPGLKVKHATPGMVPYNSLWVSASQVEDLDLKFTQAFKDKYEGLAPGAVSDHPVMEDEMTGELYYHLSQIRDGAGLVGDLSLKEKLHPLNSSVARAGELTNVATHPHCHVDVRRQLQSIFQPDCCPRLDLVAKEEGYTSRYWSMEKASDGKEITINMVSGSNTYKVLLFNGDGFLDDEDKLAEKKDREGADAVRAMRAEQKKAREAKDKGESGGKLNSSASPAASSGTVRSPLTTAELDAKKAAVKQQLLEAQVERALVMSDIEMENELAATFSAGRNSAASERESRGKLAKLQFQLVSKEKKFDAVQAELAELEKMNPVDTPSAPKATPVEKAAPKVTDAQLPNKKGSESTASPVPEVSSEPRISSAKAQELQVIVERLEDDVVLGNDKIESLETTLNHINRLESENSDLRSQLEAVGVAVSVQHVTPVQAVAPPPVEDDEDVQPAKKQQESLFTPETKNVKDGAKSDLPREQAAPPVRAVAPPGPTVLTEEVPLVPTGPAAKVEVSPTESAASELAALSEETRADFFTQVCATMYGRSPGYKTLKKCDPVIPHIWDHDKCVVDSPIKKTGGTNGQKNMARTNTPQPVKGVHKCAYPSLFKKVMVVENPDPKDVDMLAACDALRKELNAVKSKNLKFCRDIAALERSGPRNALADLAFMPPVPFPILGIDCEWSASMWNADGKDGKIALLQLCSGEVCAVFRLNMYDPLWNATNTSDCAAVFPEPLKSLLEDTTVVKAGVGAVGDRDKFYKDYGLAVGPTLDTEVAADIFLHESKRPYSSNLLSLTESVCGVSLSKSKRLTISNWASREAALSPQQVEYASDDARASYGTAYGILQEGYAIMRARVNMEKDRKGVKASSSPVPASAAASSASISPPTSSEALDVDDEEDEL